MYTYVLVCPWIHPLESTTLYKRFSRFTDQKPTSYHHHRNFHPFSSIHHFCSLFFSNEQNTKSFPFSFYIFSLKKHSSPYPPPSILTILSRPLYSLLNCQENTYLDEHPVFFLFSYSPLLTLFFDFHFPLPFSYFFFSCLHFPIFSLFSFFEKSIKSMASGLERKAMYRSFSWLSIFWSGDHKK